MRQTILRRLEANQTLNAPEEDRRVVRELLYAVNTWAAILRSIHRFFRNKSVDNSIGSSSHNEHVTHIHCIRKHHLGRSDQLPRACPFADGPRSFLLKPGEYGAVSGKILSNHTTTIELSCLPLYLIGCADCLDFGGTVNRVCTVV